MDDWRKAWAKRPEDLDILVSSAYPDIRICVAAIGRPSDLDKLAYDEEPIVRAAVAEQGRDKDLDQLLSDEYWQVRRIAARQLPNSMSASEAQEALAEAGLSISQAVQAAMTKVDQAKQAMISLFQTAIRMRRNSSNDLMPPSRIWLRKQFQPLGP